MTETWIFYFKHFNITLPLKENLRMTETHRIPSFVPKPYLPLKENLRMTETLFQSR